MPLERDKDNYGLDAFRQAINRQEGSFMRAATLIFNAPKSLNTETDNESVARKLQARCAETGKFTKEPTD